MYPAPPSHFENVIKELSKIKVDKNSDLNSYNNKKHKEMRQQALNSKKTAEINPKIDNLKDDYNNLLYKSIKSEEDRTRTSTEQSEQLQLELEKVI